MLIRAASTLGFEAIDDRPGFSQLCPMRRELRRLFRTQPALRLACCFKRCDLFFQRRDLILGGVQPVLLTHTKGGASPALGGPCSTTARQNLSVGKRGHDHQRGGRQNKGGDEKGFHDMLR